MNSFLKASDSISFYESTTVICNIRPIPRVMIWGGSTQADVSWTFSLWPHPAGASEL